MLRKTRICVFVSGGGTNLQALIDSQGSVLKSGEITLVAATNDRAYALERAKKAGIESVVIAPKSFESRQAYEEALKATLREKEIDMIVLAGFMTILSEDFIKEYRDRIINVHPSLIPSFCGDGYYGLKVHEEALKRGVKVTGATVHFVNEITDGGRIILQKAVEVMDNDTPETLQKRVMEQAEWILLPRACEMVAADIAASSRFE